MFWGLIMEPKRRYTQTVKKAFHVSMAALDVTSGSDEPSQVLLNYDGRNYLLCTLQKEKNLQVPLDLNFEEGDEVSFATNGSGHVHLTGYLINEEANIEEEEQEDEEESVSKKETSHSDSVKKRKNPQSNSPKLPAKKSKTEQMIDAVKDEGNESDSDDVNFSDLLDEEDFDESSDEGSDQHAAEEIDEEEEDEEGQGDSDEMLGEESEGEESSLSEEDEAPMLKKAKVNGVTPTPKKKEKNKQEQQQQQVQQKQEKTPKHDKQKKKDTKTPLKENKTPNKEVKTQGEEGKTPGKEGKKTGKEGKTPGKEQKTPQEKQQQQQLQKKTLEGGVQIQDLVVGTGQVAKPGKMVQVYYEGRLKSNNKVFDSVKQGNGFKFRLGQHEVIKGWDVGVQGMKVGGKRRFTCPPNMAYGQKGSPPVIPANATLVFEVELKNVH